MEDSRLKKIENDVLLATTSVTHQKESVENIYGGRTKCTLTQGICRCFIYVILHDVYGLSWRNISSKTGRSVQAIRKKAYACRNLTRYDVLFISVYNRLRAEYGDFCY
jgi:hypothetical protein